MTLNVISELPNNLGATPADIVSMAYTQHNTRGRHTIQLLRNPYYGRSCADRTTGIQSLSWASKILILHTLASLGVLLVLKMEDVALDHKNSDIWLS